MKLHEAIKMQRESLKMNVKEFAEFSGVPYHHYRRFEHGGFIRPEAQEMIMSAIGGKLFSVLVISNGDTETKIKID